jgi:hypothetical protein
VWEGATERGFEETALCEWPLARSSNLSGLGLPQRKETAGQSRSRCSPPSTGLVDKAVDTLRRLTARVVDTPEMRFKYCSRFALEWFLATTRFESTSLDTPICGVSDIAENRQSSKTQVISQT